VRERPRENRKTQTSQQTALYIPFKFKVL
jgi:hypothetical protein